MPRGRTAASAWVPIAILSSRRAKPAVSRNVRVNCMPNISVNDSMTSSDLVSPARAVRPQELEGQSIVDGEIEPVAGGVQQVEDECAITNDQEDEKVVENENDEAAVVGAIGELLDAQRRNQRVRARSGSGSDRPAHPIRRADSRALAPPGTSRSKMKVAMCEFPRRERGAIASGGMPPSAIPLGRPQIEMVDKRIVLAQQDVPVIACGIDQGEANPPGRARESEIRTDLRCRPKRIAGANGVEIHRAGGIFEHVHVGNDGLTREIAIDRGRQFLRICQHG